MKKLEEMILYKIPLKGVKNVNKVLMRNCPTTVITKNGGLKKQRHCEGE